MDSLDTFSALADPTRRRILELLRQGERPVNDIVAAVDIQQSGVSRHLKILSDAGFVTVRPHGQQRLYALRPDPFRHLDTWLQRYRALWESRLDRLDAALKKKQNEKGKEK